MQKRPSVWQIRSNEVSFQSQYYWQCSEFKVYFISSDFSAVSVLNTFWTWLLNASCSISVVPHLFNIRTVTLCIKHIICTILSTFWRRKKCSTTSNNKALCIFNSTKITQTNFQACVNRIPQHPINVRALCTFRMDEEGPDCRLFWKYWPIDVIYSVFLIIDV